MRAQAMATSRDVFNRIRWDARFDPRRFVIGYVERGAMGFAEKPFDEWDGSIPWHRVHYFRVGEKRVWDRDVGVDLVTSGEALDHAASPRGEVPAPGAGFARLQVLRFVGDKWSAVEGDAAPALVKLPLRVATWNVLSDRHDPGFETVERRLHRVFSVLEALEADVIALQEVTPAILALLLARPWVRERYRTTDATGVTLGPEGTLLLARVPIDAECHVFPNQKRAVLARVLVAGRPLEVLALHATSDRAKDARRKRAHELERVAARLAGDDAGAPDALVLGDLNARDEDPGGLGARGFVDVWRALRPGEAGFTYDPTTNDLTRRTSTSGVPARFDRALHRARALDVVRIERFGNSGERAASDHDGLVLDLVPAATIDASPVTTTALAVLVPPGLREPIDALRRVHDPSYPRWMPHANLLYGFVPEERFAEAAALVARAVVGARPFLITLARFEVFEHRSSATVHLVPDVEPERAFSDLWESVSRRFPRCTSASAAKSGFVPHVTVGRFASAEIAREHAARLALDWEPVRFLARSVDLIARTETTPFAVRHEVLFGGALERWLARRGELESPEGEALRGRVASLVLECGRRLDPMSANETVGSTRLGVARAGSDLDLLVVTTVAPELVAAALERELGTPVRLVPNARVPLARFEVAGLPVDVQIAAPQTLDVDFKKELADERAGGVDSKRERPLDPALEPVRAALELRARGEGVAPGGQFALVVRALRAWASTRSLDAQAWGFPGGFAWALVAAWALEGASPSDAPEERLVRVFERARDEAWPESIVAVCRSLTPGTRSLVAQELARAAQVSGRVLAGAATWDQLVTVPDLESLTHLAWLRAEPRGTAAGEAGRGFVERAGVGLVLDLERLAGVSRVRPFAARASGVVLGLRATDAKGVEVQLARLAADLEREVKGARLEWGVEALE